MDTIDFLTNQALRLAGIALCICACIKLIRSLPKRDRSLPKRDRVTVIEPDDDWCADDEDIFI